eukprot:GEMP01000966.1.p1 GENE.GEMP01000966.1~~GEMP01000966.1.p1  ORF type:complete len:1524 (+),score=336.72 GEMP01000966.1:337-4908(+)
MPGKSRLDAISASIGLSRSTLRSTRDCLSFIEIVLPGNFVEAADDLVVTETEAPWSLPVVEVRRGQLLFVDWVDPRSLECGNRRMHVRDIATQKFGWIDLWLPTKSGQKDCRVRAVKKKENVVAMESHIDNILRPDSTYLEVIAVGSLCKTSMVTKLRDSVDPDSTELFFMPRGEPLRVLEIRIDLVRVQCLQRRRVLGWLKLKTTHGYACVEALESSVATALKSASNFKRICCENMSCVTKSGPLSMITYENGKVSSHRLDEGAVFTLVKLYGADAMKVQKDGKHGWMLATDDSGKFAVADDVSEKGLKTADIISAQRKYFVASRTGDLNMLKEAIAGIDDINCTDSEGRTALIYAVAGGQKIIVHYLLANDAVEVFRKDDHGKIALHHVARIATHAHSPSITKLLLQATSQPDSVDYFGRTPLHLVAASSSCIETAQMLINAGASRQALSSTSMTPSHYADLSGNEAMVKLLGTARSPKRGSRPTKIPREPPEIWCIESAQEQRNLTKEEEDELYTCLRKVIDDNSELSHAVVAIVRAFSLDVVGRRRQFEEGSEKEKALRQLTALFAGGTAKISMEMCSAAIARYEDAGATPSELQPYWDIYDGKKTIFTHKMPSRIISEEALNGRGSLVTSQSAKKQLDIESPDSRRSVRPVFVPSARVGSPQLVARNTTAGAPTTAPPEPMSPQSKAVQKLQGALDAKPFSLVDFGEAITSYKKSGGDPNEAKEFTDAYEKEKRILKESLDTAVKENNKEMAKNLIPLAKQVGIPTADAQILASKNLELEAAQKKLDEIVRKKDDFDAKKFETALANFVANGALERDVRRYRFILEDEKRKRGVMVSKVEEDLRRALLDEDVVELESLLPKAKKLNIDVADSEKALKEIPQRRATLQRLNAVVSRRSIPMAEFATLLEELSSQGGAVFDVKRFQGIYSAEDKRKKRRELSKNLAAAESILALVNAIDLACASNIMPDRLLVPYQELLKSMKNVDEAAESLGKELEKKDDEIRLDMLRIWIKAMKMNKKSSPSIQKAQKFIDKNAKEFDMKQDLKNCAEEDPSTGKPYLSALWEAIERAKPTLKPEVVAIFEKKLNDEEKFLKVRESMAAAESYTMHYNTVDCIQTLEAGKKAVSHAISVAQECGLPATELEQLLLHRRRIHNRIEGLKGKIRIFSRIRPLFEATTGLEVEVARKIDEHSLCIGCDENGDDESEKTFAFDATFAPGAQADIFKDVADLIQSAVDGYNCAIFAYGQTGSGKTHTMYGIPSDPGIVPRAAAYLFQLINQSKSLYDLEVFGCSYEIYKSKINDLLLTKEALRLTRPPITVGWDEKLSRVSLEGLTETKLQDSKDFNKIVQQSMETRKVGVTSMNAQSSRSHQIVQIRIVARRKGQAMPPQEGKIVLIDLAGSERLKKSGVSDEAAEEAVEINKSLTALGDVMVQAADGQKNIPYRNHVLTKVMRDAIGGHAKTLMFVNISPALSNRDETLQSLRWATRAKDVKIVSIECGGESRKSKIATITPRRSTKASRR